MSNTKLSVNINKIATLRNSRGGGNPSLVEAAIKAQQFGADGITVHPRPDERHVRYQDIHDLKSAVYTEYNIEGYPNEKFMEIVLDVKPTQATLVPDPPGVLTSNAGWDTIDHADFLTGVIIFPLGEGGVLSNKCTTISAAGIDEATTIACEETAETKDIKRKKAAAKTASTGMALSAREFMEK